MCVCFCTNTSTTAAVQLCCKVALYKCTLHYITSHHITSHHITSHHITSHHITSHPITSHHITSHHITVHYITLHYITLHYIIPLMKFVPSLPSSTRATSATLCSNIHSISNFISTNPYIQHFLDIHAPCNQITAYRSPSRPELICMTIWTIFTTDKTLIVQQVLILTHS